jgi:hypothetical protein
VDALLLSAGVNDLGFSHLIKHCAFDGTDTDCWHHSGEDAGGADPETDVEDKLAELPARYDNLAKTIKAKLHPARTYIAQYPVRLFTDEDDRHGGCGFASAINEDEAAEFTRHGETLNQAIAMPRMPIIGRRCPSPSRSGITATAPTATPPMASPGSAAGADRRSCRATTSAPPTRGFSGTTRSPSSSRRR